MKRRILTTAIVLAAVAAVIITLLLILQRDEKITSRSYRWGALDDTARFAPTEQETEIARRFSDSTLPGLQRLGLITGYARNDMETIISVSGMLWNERTPFFKERLLDQIFIYNKVQGHAVKTKIVDGHSFAIYAQILPPNQRIIF